MGEGGTNGRVNTPPRSANQTVPRCGHAGPLPVGGPALPPQHQKPKGSEQQVTPKVIDLGLLLPLQAGVQGRGCAWCLPLPAEPLPLRSTHVL